MTWPFVQEREREREEVCRHTFKDLGDSGTSQKYSYTQVWYTACLMGISIVWRDVSKYTQANLKPIASRN